MPIDLTSKVAYIKKIKIFENENFIFFIGTHNVHKSLHYLCFKKIKFDNENKLLASSFFLKDILFQNEKVYNKTSLQDLIVILSKKTHQKLKFIADIFCFFGFVKFFLGYYAILITEISKVGKIGRHIINRVEKVNVYPLFTIHDSLLQDNIYSLEIKYLSLFKNFDFTKQIYFSYSYDLTKTLQRNFVENLKKDIVPNYSSTYYTTTNDKKKFSLKLLSNNNFLWNHFHLKEFLSVAKSPLIWLVFFIYGFFEQTECNLFGMRLLVTVIARRNRHFAGTRYLKRGINNDGNVANDVETEQILEEISTTWSDQPMISSYIHIRGSVPIYWYQESNSIIPKPNIKVNLTDIRFESTKRHFGLLTERYGQPCIVCNLTKKKEIHKQQETLLNFWYSEGVNYINSTCLNTDESKIIYHHYDLKTERLQPKFYKSFYDQSMQFIEKTNLFCFIPKYKDKNIYHVSLQNGIIRSNCVDCVDRTNVYQQVIGLAVLVIQLRQMGVDAEFPEKENEEIYGVITDSYIRMGHELSTQYAGSLAHKQFIKDNRSSINKFMDKCSEIFNTVKRYFNNSFNDQHKQATINLFLGKYKVNSGLPNIWEMYNDNILHRKENLKKMESDWYDKAYSKYVLRNLLSDCETNNNGFIEFIDKKLDVSYSDLLAGLDSLHNKEESFSTSKSLKTSSKSLINLTTGTINNNNDYIISFDKYVKFKVQNEKKFEEEILFEKDLTTYCLLYSENAIQIKNFFNFSFSQIIPKFTPEISIRKIESSNQILLPLRTNIPSTEIPKIQFSTPIFETKKHGSMYGRSLYASSLRNHPIRKTKKILFPHSSTTQFFLPPHIQNSFVTKIEKPKYNVQISSFEFDGNDLNKVNNFTHFNIYDTRNSEYSSIDPFVTSNISIGNYNDVFESYNWDNDHENTNSNTKNKKNFLDFSEDLHNLFNIFSNQQNSKVQDEREENDYLIYVVDEKCLYKKINTSSSSDHHLHHHSGSGGSNNMLSLTSRSNPRRRSHENVNFFSTSKISNEFGIINHERLTTEVESEVNEPNWSERHLSPKAKVNIKCCPVKILDNFYETS